MRTAVDGYAEEGLGVVKQIQTDFRLDSLLPQISALSRCLRERHVVKVAVVGRFKAGKSSFLNEIVGREVLPVDVLPATSVITQLSYGPADRATVRFLDAWTQEIRLDDVSDFVTEKNNPENAKKVAAVDIELESLAAFGTVQFVDTPGLGSVFAGSTRTSLEWLPDVGAAVVALAVDPALSEGDLALLRDVMRFTSEIVIILTKVDQVSDEHLQAVQAFVSAELHKRLGTDFPLYPYSTQPGHEALRSGLREYLVERVVRQHEQRLDEIIGHKLRTLVRECHDYLALAEVAAEVGERARAELLKLAERERGNLVHVRREMGVLTRDLERRAHDTLADAYAQLVPAALESTTDDFNRESRTWRGHLGKTSKAFQDWAERTLRREMGQVLPLGEQFVAPIVTEAESHFKRAVRAFQDRLAQAVETALGTRFSGATFQAEIEPPCFPDTRVERTFDIPLDMVWFLVPMLIFRRLVYRRLRTQLPWEVEKNLTRVGWQWTEAASASIRGVARQAENFMQGEVDTVIDMVTATTDKTRWVKAAMAELDAIDLDRRQ
jgi:GTPase Era involved in 16S rRNA processing